MKPAGISIPLIIFVLASFLFFSIQPALAGDIDVYFFWSDGCPHCAKETAHLEFLEGQHPELKVHSYNLSESEEGYQLLQELTTAYGARTGSVPITFIGDQYIVGAYLDTVTKMVEECIKNNCINPAEKIGSTPTNPSETAPEININNSENTTGKSNQIFTIGAIIAAGIIVIVGVFILTTKK